MLNKDKYTVLKETLKSDNEFSKNDLLNNFQEELTYELTELYLNNKKEELNKELYSFKRFKKLLGGYVEHIFSYKIGIIIGIVLVMDLLMYKSAVRNEINIKMSALFSKKVNHNILVYLYHNPGSQHKVISQALDIPSNYLSQQMRELEDAGGVVRYGVDRRSFYQLTLDGQAFIEKELAKKGHHFIGYTDSLLKRMDSYEKWRPGHKKYAGDIGNCQSVRFDTDKVSLNVKGDMINV